MASLMKTTMDYLVAYEEGWHYVEETGEFLIGEELEKYFGEVFEEKVDNVASFIKSEEAMTEAINAEIKALTERKQSHAKKAESLKKYLEKCMNMKGVDKFETAKNKVTFRNSTSVDVDTDLLPKRWMVATYKPDKKAIKEAIINGKCVKGASLIIKRNMSIK